MNESIDRIETVRTLKKRVIRALQNGERLEVVEARLATLVRECDASEIALLELELMAGGIPAAQVIRICGPRHRAPLVERGAPEIPPGHPADTFRRENAALREQVIQFRRVLSALGAAAEHASVDACLVEGAWGHYRRLAEVEKHYLRKERVLFPFLERCGITGPSRVMWAKDDEVRGLLEDLGEALAACGASAGEWRLATQAVAEPALAALEEMLVKEDRILLPLLLQVLGDAEWGEVVAQSAQFGYCIVEPAAEWRR